MQIIKNISTLFGASLTSQLILIVVMPILARYYPVSAFGDWAFFVAISTTLAIISSFRYDVGIILPKKRYHAIQLVKSAVFATLLTSIMTMAIVGILFFLDIVDKVIYLLIPISMLLNGLMQIAVTWLNRYGKYKQIAGSKLIQSLSTASINIFFVLLYASNLNVGSLVAATIIGQCVGLTWLVWPIMRRENKFIKTLIRINQSKKLLVKYKDFPLYSTPEALIGIISTLLPLYAITYYFTSQEVGYVALSLKVLMLPVAVIGGAVSVVFAQRFSLKVSNGEKITNEMIKIWIISALVGLVPALIMQSMGIELFVQLFGESWKPSGEIASSLSIYIYIVLVFSLTSGAHVALRIQHISLIFAISTISIKCILVYLMEKDLLQILVAFTSVDIIAAVSINIIALYKSIKYNYENINVT